MFKDVATQSSIMYKPARPHCTDVEHSKSVIPNVHTTQLWCQYLVHITIHVSWGRCDKQIRASVPFWRCKQFDKLTLGRNAERLMAVFWASRHLEPVVFSRGNVCVRCWVIFSRQLGGDWWSFVAQPECWRQQGVNSWEFSEKTTCYLKGGGLLPHPLQPFICGSVLTNAAHPVSAPDT